MASGALPALICGCVTVLCLLVFCGLTSLAATDIALKYSYVHQSVSPDVLVMPGVMWIGPFTTLLRYPKTIQTIEFSKGTGDLLDGRTSDGLPLQLGLSFQYRLLPSELYNLYTEYEQNSGDYQRVYKLMAMHFATELATNYTAYKFFNEKQFIADEMRMFLDRYFVASMHATVESLQINEDDLPQPFTDALLEAQIVNTNKTRMQNVKQAKVVEFQTAVLVAEAQANVTLQKAEGQVHYITQNGRADTAIIEAYVEAEKGSYKSLIEGMHFSGDGLMQYMWYDSLAGGSVAAVGGVQADMNVLVNVNPAAYITPAAAA